MNKIKEIKKLIDNKIGYSNKKKYCAIIGLNPSKGARSPLLWNKAFKENNLDIQMLPLDIKKNKLNKLFNTLKNDKFFLGGAIAAPHKISIFELLKKNINRETKPIGAVNCLYRKKNGELFGTNTDGEAGLKSFKEKFKNFENKKILIFGLGGVGKAIASFFSNEIKSKRNLILFSKNKKNIDFAKKLKTKMYSYEDINIFYNSAEILINCTDLGSNIKKKLSILDKKQIKDFKKKIIIFDVIYDPIETNLLRIAKSERISSINGLKMNLYQAIIAYNYCIDKKLRIKDTKKIMSNFNAKKT